MSERHNEPHIPEVGDYVKFTNSGGYDHERKRAAKELKMDRTYIVTKCRVDTWISYLWFAETGEHAFNSVMFRRVDAAGRPFPTNGAPPTPA